MLYFFWFIRICLLSTLSVLFAFIHRLRRDLRNWEFLFWQRSWGHSSVYSVSAALHFHVFQFLRSFYPYRPNLNYIRSKPSIPVYSVLNFIFSSPELLVLTVGFTSTQKHFLYSQAARHRIYFQWPVTFTKQGLTMSDAYSFRCGCSYRGGGKSWSYTGHLPPAAPRPLTR